MDIVTESGVLRTLRGITKYLLMTLKLKRIEGKIIHIFSSSYGNFFANGLLLIAGKVNRRKTVISMMGGGFPSVVQKSSFAKRFLIRAIFRYADLITVCNEKIRESILSLGIKNYKLIHISNALPFDVNANGAVAPSLNNFLKTHRPFITSVAALSPAYGVPILIRAVAKLRRSFPNIGLLLVVLTTSDKKTATEVRSLLRTGKLSDSILIKKNVTSLHTIIKKSDLFVRSTLADGDSMSVREALFLGVPVVASDTAFRPKDVVLFKKGDVDDLSDKMKRVIENRQSFLPKYASAEARENLQKIEAMYRKLTTSV
ncbi:hypothetical protein AMJ87_14050 [candidate division WOR_3 bacterium SM23_60]|uniref:Glycosyl transferase family 1 domain-containing protein n=1 Tax=candidate division WOR_3 bacterium SM23_60 TaxID=1703780 RepID=A0A0S8G377_UNCW3|nr:MAG: hypothetical protein AMJ87_14050 [candidate division WOR_3 bacterium SM23_60]